MRYRGPRLEAIPAVGERIGRHIDHARDERAIEREAESATAETSSSHGRRHEKARSRLRAPFLERAKRRVPARAHPAPPPGAAAASPARAWAGAAAGRP